MMFSSFVIFLFFKKLNLIACRISSVVFYGAIRVPHFRTSYIIVYVVCLQYVMQLSHDGAKSGKKRVFVNISDTSQE